MAIARTARGTATDKTGALVLTIAGVQVARRLLIVGVAYDVGNGDPVVKWGNRTLDKISGANANGINCGVWGMRKRTPAKTKDVTATWSGTAPTAKAMFCSTFSQVEGADIISTATQAGTASPNSGTAQTTTQDEEVFIGIMGSEGPQGDTAGTPSNGYTAGQRAGTVGAPPVSNITIQEIYKIVSATESTQAELTGATARDWSSTLVTFGLTRDGEFGVGGSDWDDVQEIFDSQERDENNAAYRYNSLLRRMEVYDVNLPVNGTLIATWKENTSVGWVEEV